jgi:hypothetical protein
VLLLLLLEGCGAVEKDRTDTSNRVDDGAIFDDGKRRLMAEARTVKRDVDMDMVVILSACFCNVL